MPQSEMRTAISNCEYIGHGGRRGDSGRRLFGLGALWLLLMAMAAAQQSAPYRVQTIDGVDWFLDPHANPVMIAALNGIHLASSARQNLDAGAIDQRSAQILAELNRLHFNALGPDADADLWHRGLPYLISLDVSAHLAALTQSQIPDVWGDSFVSRVNSIAQDACAPRAADRQLIGYFSDDGLNWLGGANAPAALLTYYLNLPVSSGGRQEALDFVRLRYGDDIRRLNRAWHINARDFEQAHIHDWTVPAYAADGDAFLTKVLAHYLQVVADAIHAADQNHLFLGARIDPTVLPSGTGATPPAWQVLTSANVISVSISPMHDATAMIHALAKATNRPLFVAFKGCYAPAVSMGALLAEPSVVGYLWEPGADWEAGSCSMVDPAWADFNRAANAAHAVRTRNP